MGRKGGTGRGEATTVAVNKGGRPRKEIDFEEFEKLCALQCTVDEMCSWFRVTDRTLENRVREQYHEGFSAVFAKKRTTGKIALRRNLLKMSERNPAVAIFLAKNWLGMTDRPAEEEADRHQQPVVNVGVTINASSLAGAAQALMECGAIQRISAN